MNMFFCGRNCNTLVGDIRGIYSGTLVDNRNYPPIVSLEKVQGDSSEVWENNRWLLWW